MKDIYAETGLPLTLAELGVSADAVPTLALDASQSGSVLFNPRKPTRQDIERLYLACLTGK